MTLESAVSGSGQGGVEGERERKRGGGWPEGRERWRNERAKSKMLRISHITSQ